MFCVLFWVVEAESLGVVGGLGRSSSSWVEAVAEPRSWMSSGLDTLHTILRCKQ